MNRLPKGKFQVRLAPIIEAYLDDLAKSGVYGEGHSGIIRRFVEDGVRAAIKDGFLKEKDDAVYRKERPGGESEPQADE